MTANFTLRVDDAVLRNLGPSTDARVEQFLNAEAEMLLNDIKMSIQAPSFGRAYTRGDKTHIASRPGDPPNIDMGTLIGGYDWKPVNPTTRWVYTNVEYAPILEFGSEVGLAAGMFGPKQQRMAPRPHVGPAVERRRAKLAEDAANFGLVR